MIAALAVFGIAGQVIGAADLYESGNSPAILAQVDTDSPSYSTGTRHALLTDVGEHLYNKVPYERKRMGKKKSFPEDLGGAVNDVEIIKDVLIRRFDFKPDNIVTLTDSEATGEAILVAMRKIVEEARPAQNHAVTT
jgi:hypothetical protein